MLLLKMTKPGVKQQLPKRRDITLGGEIADGKQRH